MSLCCLFVQLVLFFSRFALCGLCYSDIHLLGPNPYLYLFCLKYSRLERIGLCVNGVFNLKSDHLSWNHGRDFCEMMIIFYEAPLGRHCSTLRSWHCLRLGDYFAPTYLHWMPQWQVTGAGFACIYPLLISCESLGGPGPMHSLSEWEKLLQTRYITQSVVCTIMWQLASIHGIPYLLVIYCHHPPAKQTASH